MGWPRSSVRNGERSCSRATCSSSWGAASTDVWDRGGLVLYYKRLERGRFRPPTVTADGTAVEVDTTALAMLLDGIDVRQVRRPDLWTPALGRGRRTEGIDKTIEP